MYALYRCQGALTKGLELLKWVVDCRRSYSSNDGELETVVVLQMASHPVAFDQLPYDGLVVR